MKKRFVPILFGLATASVGMGGYFGVSAEMAASDSIACVQMIQPAIDPATGACKEFPTPCDVPSGWKTVAGGSCPAVTATGTDTSLTDLDAAKNRENERRAQDAISMRTFRSCTDMREQMLKLYSNSWARYGRGGYEDGVVYDMAAPTANMSGAKWTVTMEQSAGVTASAPDAHSSTNVQVLGVDESESVKTDGEYVYYYNDTNHEIEVLRGTAKDSATLVRRVKVPASFSQVELYLVPGKKLVIVANRSMDGSDARPYWYDRSVRTAVVVYDISDPTALAIDRYSLVDGSISQSRMIGDVLYVLSNSSFRPTVYPMGVTDDAFARAASVAGIVPTHADVRLAPGGQTVRLPNGATASYVAENGANADCDAIEYVMPDEKTAKIVGFDPRFVTLTSVDTARPAEKIVTKVLFGSSSEIHMSQKNLYVTSPIALDVGAKFSCPANARCFVPPYGYASANTAVHKFAIDGKNLSYRASALVAGQSLNQYSMDESASGTFRIVTSQYGYAQGNSTAVYLLDSDLKGVGKIENIAPGENFKAARYIGDKLFLVTYQQLDPLFVVDMAKENAPKIVGELKVPGFSTYLHPYDATRLIGIGYDTEKTQWGGMGQGGVKVSLYSIDYSQRETAESRCGTLKNGDTDTYASCVADVDPTRIRVSQAAGATFGNAGSYAAVLDNPRLFVWDKDRSVLAMPSTIVTRTGVVAGQSRVTGYFQGALVLSIRPEGIKELARISHLDLPAAEKSRQEACEGYVKAADDTPACVTLIGGVRYCPPKQYSYVPQYCYQDSPIDEYVAENSWSMNSSMVDRTVYLGSTLYVLSNAKATLHDRDASGYAELSEVPFGK